MKRKRLLVLSLILALMVFSLLLASAASANGQRRRRPIQWDQPRIRHGVVPGETYTATVVLTSTRELENVKLRVTPSLEGMLTFTPTGTFSLTNGMTRTVTITLTVPSVGELKGRESLNGLLKVRKVRRERVRRAYPRHLRLRFPITY